MPYAVSNLLLYTLGARIECTLSCVFYFLRILYLSWKQRNGYFTHCSTENAVKVQVYQRSDNLKFTLKIKN